VIKFILYVPTFNEEKDITVLHSLVKSKPLGSWSTIANGEIVRVIKI